MAILIFIFNLHLKLLYFLFKLLPVDKRKVVFLSRNFDSPSLDYRLLNDELKKAILNYTRFFYSKNPQGHLSAYRLLFSYPASALSYCDYECLRA